MAADQSGPDGSLWATEVTGPEICQAYEEDLMENFNNQDRGFLGCGDHVLQVLLDLKEANLGRPSASFSLGIRWYCWHLLIRDPSIDVVWCELTGVWGKVEWYETHGWPLTPGRILPLPLVAV